MTRDEYLQYDAIGLAELVRAGEVTPLELLACAVGMLHETQSRINAIASYDEQLGHLKALDARPGIFHGVPFLVKELLAYPGLKTAMGSRLFAQNFTPDASEYVRKIDASGLVTFGNTTSSEFGLLGSTETLLHGTTKNPWNSAYSAAGSSGGSAAAVAAGVVPMAHASDGGGSIRVPASVCGLFGFKPSAGRCVPAMEHGNPFSDLVSEHCITRSVRDSAAFLSVTEQTGADAPFPPVGFCQQAKSRRFRIGVYTKSLTGREADPDILESIQKTASLCGEIGHEVHWTGAPDIDGKAVSTAFFTLAGFAMDQMRDLMEQMLQREVNANDLEPFTLSLIEWFQTLGEDAVTRAMTEMKAASDKMLEFADDYDVLLCPTLTGSPKELGFLSPELERERLIERTEEYVGYTPIHNIAGMCAMSVPLFTDSNGMPIGSHFAAKPGAEADLFELAYQLENAAPWIKRLPCYN